MRKKKLKKSQKKKPAFKEFREKLKYLDPFTYVDLWVMPKVNPKDNKLIEAIVYLVSAAFFAFMFIYISGLILGTTFPYVIVLSGSMEPLLYRGDILLITGVEPEAIVAPEVELSQSIAGKSFNQYGTAYCKLKSGKEIDCLEVDLTSNPLTDFTTTRLEFSPGEFIEVTTEGDIIVYHSTKGLPVIHRAVAKIKATDGTFLLTKGDSVLNPSIDQQSDITDFAVQQELEGKAVSFLGMPLKIPLLGYVKLLPFDDLPKFIASLMQG